MPQFSSEAVQKILKRQRLLNQEIFMHQRVMEGMREGLKFEDLLKLVVHSVRKGLGFKRAGVFLLEPDGKHIKLAMGTDKKGRFEREKDYLPILRKKGASPTGDVICGFKKYFLSNNIPKRIPKRTAYRVEVYNNAVVPIQVGKGNIIGTLAVDNLYENRPITQSDVSSLMNYATQVGLAIESFWAHERIVNLSLTDPLTGLYNRRYFEKALDQELKRCQRYNRLCSVMMIDIDRFKRINDNYGHQAGDRILCQVALLLRNNVRNLDTVARVGGEEFAIILPETPPQNISVVANRLLRETRRARPEVEGMVRRSEGITFSLGLVGFRGGSTTPAALMKLADKSLYHAKKNGRNRSGPLQVVNGKG